MLKLNLAGSPNLPIIFQGKRKDLSFILKASVFHILFELTLSEACLN